MAEKQWSSLVQSVRRWARVEGSNPTDLSGLRVYRADRPRAAMATLYEASLCLVVQGSKSARVADTTHRYDPMKCLVVSLPLVAEAEVVEASKEAPMLCVVLSIDVGMVGQLVLEMDSVDSRANAVPDDAPVLYVSKMQEELLDAWARLFQAIETPTSRHMLAPGIIREILFRVLTGEQGDRLRAIALHQAGSRHVARAVKFLSDHYDDPIDIPTLAQRLGVSTSTLHHSFKDLMAMSPMQYLKELRLHRARLMMVTEDLSVGEAAFRVGYGSPSQFSREFKRQFGLSPGQAKQEIMHPG